VTFLFGLAGAPSFSCRVAYRREGNRCGRYSNVIPSLWDFEASGIVSYRFARVVWDRAGVRSSRRLVGVAGIEFLIQNAIEGYAR
jgi:hypothetical protein